jgi:RNA polymerase sigma factor (sigma-70 family)
MFDLVGLSHFSAFRRHHYEGPHLRNVKVAEHDWLAQQFEGERGHLRAVAYRMLGSVSEADDAVQEAWLRLSRSDARNIENLGGWLTTVVARVCLDMLRSRTSRREESLAEHLSEPAAPRDPATDPEQEALLADSVGLALLVVLDRLTPPERLAFVLHDMFAVPFEEIGSIVGRSPETARQLASRARRRVQGVAAPPKPDLPQQRKTVSAFISALRSRDIEGLVAVLDPEVVVRIDATATGTGAPREIRGARNWAKGAVAFAHFAPFLLPALIDGAVGAIFAPGGRLERVVRFTFKNEKIHHVEIVADPVSLEALDLAVVDFPS